MAWLSPAWRASLLAEVGSHLGQTYEKLGRREEAASGFRLAKLAVNKNTPPNVVEVINGGLARTHAVSTNNNSSNVLVASKGGEELQNLRSYKLKRPAAASGWGTFRLEVTTSGVIEAQQMSGEQKLSASIKPALLAMKFPELLPASSKAHLLRSAVVSCSMGNSCDVVLVPDANLQTEQP